MMLITAFLPLSAAAAGSPSPALDVPGYRVQPGDVLEVSVWGEEGLRREVLVRPDGGFSYPLAGDVKAAGIPVDEIQKDLSGRLAKYIPEPEVTVSLRAQSGNVVYVIGQVNKPGQILVHRPLDVAQAIGVAGGLTRFADRDDIKVLRRNTDGQVAFPFNYNDIEEGQRLEQNIVLQPGDVVVVP